MKFTLVSSNSSLAFVFYYTKNTPFFRHLHFPSPTSDVSRYVMRLTRHASVRMTTRVATGVRVGCQGGRQGRQIGASAIPHQIKI